MRRIALFLLLIGLFSVSCKRETLPDAASLRGLPQEEIAAMREEILDRHADGSSLTGRELARVELLREQERRLENAWVFGEWRERHGTRLIFRDDGTVSVGARGGYYDSLGVYKFISPELPSYESTWTVVYDAGGQPVVLVDRHDGTFFRYPFRRSRDSVYEEEGDLTDSSATGCYFTKM